MTLTAPLSASRRRRWLLLGVLAVIAAALLSVCLSPDGFVALDVDNPLLQLRTKRVAQALLAGGVLGGTGVILQALLHNPLADPYIIGVSGGAALGGTVVLVVVGASPVALMAGSSAGGLITLLVLTAFLARSRRGGDPALLAGVVINAFAAALITLVKTALPADKAQALMFWLVGQIGYPSSTTLLATGAFSVGALLLCVTRAGKLELLSFGDDDAQRLGVNVQRERLLFFIVAALLVGMLIPQVGMIGFLGLVLPHVLRRVVDADHRLLLPLSILSGAAALALLDGVARLLFPVLQTELPVGALTAVVFAPIFAWSLFTEVRS